MNENEFLLQDRLQKIRQIIGKYGEDKFAISYSGGKDSNVLSALIDMALPDNKIPRVFADTGIELNAVRDFVKAKAAEDDRFVMIKPTVPIKKMLETEGYPFKSKAHSRWLRTFQSKGCDINAENMAAVRHYLGIGKTWATEKSCPQILRYQFTAEFADILKCSEKCCDRLKKDPLTRYQREHGRPYYIIGIMADEHGQRTSAKCLAFKNDKLKAFQPLAPVTKDWENWFIDKYDIKLPIVYYPPFNFPRTGCKGCPFNVQIQRSLDILKADFPNEYKQCEKIWAPVYAEYRRIGYRLRPIDEDQLTFFDE